MASLDSAPPFPDAPAEFRIGLAPVGLDLWLTADAAATTRKEALLAADRAQVWGETGGSRPAQAEALAMIRDWSGAGPPVGDAPPLWQAARLVADDLCLMERRGGDWTLTAASLCAATFFTAEAVVGRPLARLHAPVPGFGEGLLERIVRVFERLPPDRVLERRNWTVVNSDDLFLPDPAPVRARLAEGPQPLFLRSERQSLRRLPASGALLFAIHVTAEPLERLLSAPARRDAFARAWTHVMGTEGAAFRSYKRLELYDPLVRAALAAACR